jgi:hypothetical protein
MPVRGVANLVCTVENADGNLTGRMESLTEATHHQRYAAHVVVASRSGGLRAFADRGPGAVYDSETLI